MPLPQQQLIRLLTAAFFAATLIVSFNSSVEAKGRKARRAAGASRSKSARGHYARGGRSGRGRKAHRLAAESFAQEPEPNHVIVPDRIEVIENGYSDSASLSRSLNMPNPTTSFASVDLTSSPRRLNIKIEPNRVIEIQQALTSRGYYRGEINGAYDELTVDAMRRFQTNEKISATGYPTAHALRRLGLGNW